MALEINFSPGTVITASFLNDQQQLHSSAAHGITVQKTSVTTIAIIPAEDGSAGQSSLAINGQPYWITSAISYNFTGQPAGTYLVYLVPGTSPAFAFSVVASGGSAPSGPHRGPVATVVWSGSQITSLVNTIQDVSGHSGNHNVGGADALAGLTDGNMAPANVDGAMGTPSLRTLGAGAQQASAGNDTRHPPVGAQMGYTGLGDPGTIAGVPGVWVIADGRLIDSTTYATFDATCGRTATSLARHAYNLGIDPGNNKVKIPDKRGRHSLGAQNMGSAAGAASSSATVAGQVLSVVTTLGSKVGEVDHSLSAGENGSHSHSGTTGTESADHSHYTSGATGGQSADHSHGTESGSSTGTFNFGSQFTTHGYGSDSTGGTSNDHSHGFGAQSGGRSAAHTHNFTTDYGGSGGQAHNNVGPSEVDCVIVRIA